MKKIIGRIKNWFKVNILEWNCPKCGGELLETYSGACGGKRCSKCDYRVSSLL